MATPVGDSYSCDPGGGIAAGRYRWPAWRRGATARTWAQIGNTPNDVNPKNRADLNPNGAGNTPPWGNGYATMVTAWSSGAYNQQKDRLAVWGEGHTDGAGNQLIDIDLNVDSPAWNLRRPPTGSTGNTGDLDDGLEASGVYFDGRPRAQHTYGQMLMLNDDLWAMPGGSQYKSGGATKHINRFDYLSGDWVTPILATSNLYDIPFFGGSVDYDSTRGLAFTGGYNNFNKFDPVTLAWVKISGFPGGLSGGNFNVRRCPLNDLIVVFNSTGTSYLFDPSSNTWTDGIPQTGTGPTASLLGSCGIEWDEIEGRFIVWTTGANLFTLTPPPSSPKTNAWTWAVLSADPSNTVSPAAVAAGTWRRFFLSPKLRVVGCINAVNEPLHIFFLE